MKIAILGYSGSGKSTLAKFLSNHYRIPLLYLDTVQFEASWEERDREEALAIVSDFMRNNDWVIDGNYVNFLQDKRLEQANYIIYMDFSRLDCLSRAYRRYRANKNTSRESVANGCNEKMDLEFVWWILYKGRTKNKKRYYEDVIARHYEKTIVLKNQKDIDQFIVNLQNSGLFAK